MDHAQALSIAERLVAELVPGCKRIEIAGSLRRMKPEVGDIEIVASPDLRPPRPAFGKKYFSSTLEAILYNLSCVDSHNGLLLHQSRGGLKYKKIAVSLDSGKTWCIQLDLFLLTPPADWGVLYLIRSGPSEFSKWMVTPQSLGGALPNGYYIERGAVWQIGSDKYLPMPEEIDFLNFCGLDWIEPRDRRPRLKRSQSVQAPELRLQNMV